MGTNKATEKSKLRAESADDFGWLDILRWMATAAVVVCHTLTALGRNPDTYGLTQHTAVVYMALSRLTDWAVPVFLMISGVLYFSPDRDLSYRRVLFRYERRILLALLIFGYPMCLAERFLADRTLAHAGRGFAHRNMLGPYVVSLHAGGPAFDLTAPEAFFGFCFGSRGAPSAVDSLSLYVHRSDAG